MAIGGPGNAGGDEGDGGEGGLFAEINITPLTDIFLVLLIIFMVTTTAIAEQGQDKGGFKVNLPKGGKGEASAIPKDLAVAVLADGRAVIGGRALDDTTLASTFKEVAGRDAETVVLVQADEGVSHGRVVQVMEAARAAGLSRLAIATRAGDAGAPAGR